jgi:hypothetical protein
MAFQVLFGVLGIGLTVLVFVILGNPTAGGAYQAQLLPPFWRTLGYVLPLRCGHRNHQADSVFRRPGHRDPAGGDRRVAVIGAGVAIPAPRFHYHRALAIEYPTAGRGGKQPESEVPDAARA